MESEAFANLYREFLPYLSRYLARRVPQAVVEDLASDVIEIAWRKRDKAPEGSELAWLYKIAGYVVSNYRTKQNNRNRIISLFLEVDNSPSAESIALADEGLSYAWKQLSEKERNVIALSSFEQLSLAEIALTLETSENAVSIRLHRAKSKLRAILNKEMEKQNEI